MNGHYQENEIITYKMGGNTSNHVSDKEYPDCIKNSYNSTTKRQTTQLKKGTRDRHFPQSRYTNGQQAHEN